MSFSQTNIASSLLFLPLARRSTTKLTKLGYFFTETDTSRLHELIEQLTQSIHKMNSDLVNHLRHRDFLSTEQSQLCDFITATLQAISSKRG